MQTVAFALSFYLCKLHLIWRKISWDMLNDYPKFLLKKMSRERNHVLRKFPLKKMWRQISIVAIAFSFVYSLRNFVSPPLTHNLGPPLAPANRLAFFSSSQTYRLSSQLCLLVHFYTIFFLNLIGIDWWFSSVICDLWVVNCVEWRFKL